MLASAAILASVVVRHNDILVRRDLRVRKKRVVGRHFAHRAPQCISSKTKVRQVLIHLLGVISSSVLPPSCRVIFNTPFWRRPFGCPSGEVGGTVVSAATLRNLHCLVCGQKMFANRRSMPPSHNKYASFVSRRSHRVSVAP